MKKLKLKKTLLALCIIMIGMLYFPSSARMVDAASKVKLNKKTVTLAKGKTVVLKLVGTKKKAKWSSNKKKVATVNASGKVTAKGVGKAVITAKVQGKKYKCTVTVPKHTHSYRLQKKVKPTCTAQGYDLYKCSCGLTKKQMKAATGHEYDAWEIVKQSTEEGTLIVRGICEKCKKADSKTKEVSASDVFYFDYVEGGVEIKGLSGTFYGSVCIPDTINEKPVIAIGELAFGFYDGLTNVTIPKGVTSIGDDAFNGCRALVSITIPEGVTSIGDDAFNGCKKLTNITLPNSIISIGKWAFYDCDGLKNITIPESVTSIGDYLFSDCNALDSIVISEGVTSIGEYAFYGCEKLKKIILPDSITSIGEMAFGDCVALGRIVIPEGVTTISNSVFNGCSGLISVIIPNSITSIGEEAFYDCARLTNIIIPNNVTSIGNFAFFGCEMLTSITIPNSVTSIGDGVFVFCPEKLTIYGESGSYAEDYAEENGIIFKLSGN